MQSPCPLPGLITMIRSKLIRSLMRPGKRTSCLARSALLACIAITAVGGLSADAGTLKELLAPMGSLRVGVYPGSPTTPARANDVSFGPTLVSVELGYLVPANSSITRADEIDRPGIRIGVTKGSTSERTLPAKFKNARIVAAENVKVAVEMLSRGELDTYATNKPTLFEMSDSMPGARVLDENWGLEHMAIAIPKGREQGRPFVGSFVQEVQTNGLLERVQQEAGLRGAIKAQP